MSENLGEYGETKEATVETQNLCHQVKTAVEEKTGEVYKEFNATKYRKQLVHGENFLIKVHVGGENYIHLIVFRSFPPGEEVVRLVDLQQNKTREDPLEPF